MRKPRQKPKPPQAVTIVLGRRPDDCMIAALANAQGWTYERAAEVLGFPCDPTTGLPALPLNVGFAMGQVIAPLLAAGTSAAYILTREHPEIRQTQGPAAMQARLSAMPSERMKRLIQGRPAILSGAWPDSQAPHGSARGHFIGWDGARLLGDKAPADLSGVTLWEALILSPGQAPETQPEPRPIAGRTLPEIFDRHERVFLAFSGGRESVVLAHMCEPWREKVTLLWVRVQSHAPHMADFIRGYAARGWRLEEIAAPGIMDHWSTAGIPAEVLPVENARGRKEPRMQPWPSCCYAIRQVPLNAYMRAQSEACALLHGQRAEDEAATAGGLSGQMPPYVEVVQPLASWSEAEVAAYVDQHGLVLPSQYAEGYADSLECLICPAAPSPQRMDYLRRRHRVSAGIAQKFILATGDAATVAVCDMYGAAGLIPTAAE